MPRTVSALWNIGPWLRRIPLEYRRQCDETTILCCEERTWVREAEEPPLLEAVAREQLVKTQQAEKGLRLL
jgi:hypothetical protein